MGAGSSCTIHAVHQPREQSQAVRTGKRECVAAKSASIALRVNWTRAKDAARQWGDALCECARSLDGGPRGRAGVSRRPHPSQPAARERGQGKTRRRVLQTLRTSVTCHTVPSYRVPCPVSRRLRRRARRMLTASERVSGWLILGGVCSPPVPCLYPPLVRRLSV